MGSASQCLLLVTMASWLGRSTRMSWECDPKMDTQMGPGIYGPGLYGPGTKVSWHLEHFIRIYLAITKAVATLLMAILVPLHSSISLFMIRDVFLPKAKSVAKCLIVMSLNFFKVTVDESWSFTTCTSYNPLQSNPIHLLFQFTPPPIFQHATIWGQTGIHS